MFKSLLILICFILCSANSTFAQEEEDGNDNVKKEIEKSIDKDELPQEILKHLQEMPIALDDAKFYYQEDVDSKSYEAKMDYEEKRYTIAFETKGRLKDIEIEIDESEIPKDVLKQINQYLEDTYERHKIEKIQLHFEPESDKKAFTNRDKPDLYELVVATKDEKSKLEKKEIRFNPEGKQVNTRKILRQSYDFLLF